MAKHGGKGLRKACCVRKKMAHGLGKTAARAACGVRGKRK